MFKQNKKGGLFGIVLLVILSLVLSVILGALTLPLFYGAPIILGLMILAVYLGGMLPF